MKCVYEKTVRMKCSWALSNNKLKYISFIACDSDVKKIHSNVKDNFNAFSEMTL